MIWAEVMIPIIAIIVVGSTISSIVRTAMSYKYRRQAPGPADPDQLRRLEETVLELRGDVTQLRDDVVDLGERLDFAERMLVRGRDDARLPEGR